jgi:protein tyrosine phosphatase
MTTHNGRVIVHCVMGVSRSCSLVLAYLMKYKGMSLKQAFDLVSSKRSVVRPNAGFWRQLIEYEKKLLNSSASASQKTSSYFSNSSPSTNIPIHIESSSSSSSSSHPQSLINALTLSSTNNYTNFRPYSAASRESRVPSSTNPHYRSSSTHVTPTPTPYRSPFNASYSSYVSPHVGSQHRTSLNSKYYSRPGMDTTYRQSYGKY